jgi:hypothetical protein
LGPEVFCFQEFTVIQETRETKVCVKCGTEKAITAFRITGVHLNLNGSQMRYRDNKCKACICRITRIKMRLELFEAFDCKCQCCGESHPDFLTLEHIDGKGKSELKRKNGRRVTTQEIYHARKSGFDPSMYSLLCINCNFAKGHWGRCPHETGITAEETLELMREATKGTGHVHRDKSKSAAGWFKKGFDGRRPSEQEVDSVLKEMK